MAREELIELTGSIEEVLPGSMYRVNIDDMNNIIV